ncbi:hypothetical protein GOODEAATRI_025533, partial [Goodea atripinnis]
INLLCPSLFSGCISFAYLGSTMIGMKIALQYVSIDDAIVDTLRAIEHRVCMEYAEHSTQDFSAVWHNHRGYCCYVFCVTQHSSLRSNEPTVRPAVDQKIADKEAKQMSIKSGHISDVCWAHVFRYMFLYAVGDAESLSKDTTCRTIRSLYLALKGYMHIFITFPGHRRTTYVKEGLYKNAGELSGVLLGDKGYACQTFLLTPFADPQTAGQRTYNVTHARTKAHIEMAFFFLSCVSSAITT